VGEVFCPFCGHTADSRKWLTQDHGGLSYTHTGMSGDLPDHRGHATSARRAPTELEADLAWVEKRGESLIEQTQFPNARAVALFACRSAGLREIPPLRAGAARLARGSVRLIFVNDVHDWYGVFVWRTWLAGFWACELILQPPSLFNTFSGTASLK